MLTTTISSYRINQHLKKEEEKKKKKPFEISVKDTSPLKTHFTLSSGQMTIPLPMDPSACKTQFPPNDLLIISNGKHHDQKHPKGMVIVL
jgi:hypothetical protein